MVLWQTIENRLKRRVRREAATVFEFDAKQETCIMTRRRKASFGMRCDNSCDGNP
jgi:hypothetical protein